MKFSTNKQEKYTVLKLEEESLNSVLAPQLKSEFVFFYNEGVRNLILDLSDCKFVDSSGLSSILVADRLWKNLGTFTLTGIQHDAVKKLIEISRLDTVLKIIPTLDESIAHIDIIEAEKQMDADLSEKN